MDDPTGIAEPDTSHQSAFGNPFTRPGIRIRPRELFWNRLAPL